MVNYEDRFKDWSVADVYWKADSEGGVASLIQWGGVGVFYALGEQGMEAARKIEDGLKTIQIIFDAYEDEIAEAQEDDEW